jgi:hypothetical protein
LEEKKEEYALWDTEKLVRRRPTRGMAVERVDFADKEVG